jgi:hypothetical protein
MSKHEENFEKGTEDMEKANEALGEGKLLKSFYYAGKGIGKPVAGVVKDPIGFATEMLKDWFK